MRGFRCRLGAARRQVADLFGHYREAFAVLTGTRRFNGRIESQQVGLEGNFVDNLDNLRDALPRFVDFVHGRHHTLHPFAALFCNLSHMPCQVVGALGVVCTHADL